MSGILCSLPLAGALFAACAAAPPFATGYVEGEFTLVAPVTLAQVRSVAVARGDRAEAGTVLVELERRDAEIALARTDAALAEAESKLADLRQGCRPEEIAVPEASLASARAQATEAERTRDRIVSLAGRGAATEAQRDDAVTAAEVARAKVAQIEADPEVARLPARPQAIAVAEAAVAGARAAQAQAAWNLDQRRLSLPDTVTVFDVIRRPGEIAGPSAPVLSVLADGAVKLRLYVPEPSLSAVAVGDRLAVNCDGCPDGPSATITCVSDAAEFTPPVICSPDNRQKIVYLIEAHPDAGSDLKPGQIVDVARPPE